MLNRLKQKAVRAVKKQLDKKNIAIKSNDYAGHFQRSLHQQIQGKIYANIGAGNFNLPGWQMLEYSTPDYRYEGADRFVEYDITSGKPLPYDDDSVDGIYCSHVFEHFDNEVGVHLMGEIARVLKKGAVARIIVPNIKLSYDAMMRGDKDYFIWEWWYDVAQRYRSYTDKPPIEWPVEFSWLHSFATERVPLHRTASPHKIELADLQDKIKKMPFEKLCDDLVSPLSYDVEHASHHINWYSEKKMIALGEATKQLKGYRSSYLQSADKQMRVEGHFDKVWPQMSLYTEFEKL